MIESKDIWNGIVEPRYRSADDNMKRIYMDLRNLDHKWREFINVNQWWHQWMVNGCPRVVVMAMVVVVVVAVHGE